MPFDQRDRGVGSVRGDPLGSSGVENRHGNTSNVQHLTEPPPLSSSDRSTPTGSKPASHSCVAKPVAAEGSTTCWPSETALRPSTYASALPTTRASGNDACSWSCAAALNAGG